MRLFAALVPPPTALAVIEDFVEPRRAADPSVRFTDVDSWHVTLAFAGQASSRALDRLTDGLTDLAARTAPLDVVVSGAGCLPHPAAAKVLYLGAGPAEDLGRLAASTRQAFSRAGIEVDGARFLPHLTIARMRRPVEATKWLHVFEGSPTASWRAADLLLIESHLRDMANRYEVVERFPLRG